MVISVAQMVAVQQMPPIARQFAIPVIDCIRNLPDKHILSHNPSLEFES